MSPESRRYSSARNKIKSTIDGIITLSKIKWNESGFRWTLCTYRLNWARRTSWGWWDDWDDTVLQTQDSKFEPWRSEVEHATFRSRRLIYWLSLVDGEETFLISFKPPRPGTVGYTMLCVCWDVWYLALDFLYVPLMFWRHLFCDWHFIQ